MKTENEIRLEITYLRGYLEGLKKAKSTDVEEYRKTVYGIEKLEWVIEPIKCIKER